MPDDGAPGHQPADEPIGALREQFADAGPAIRPAIWPLAIFIALALAAGIPAFDSWYRMVSDGGQVSLISQGFLPVTPLLVLVGLALIWNPLCRRFGVADLALRSRELLVVAAISFVSAGIVEGGLRDNWIRSLAVEEGIARTPKTRDMVAPFPNQLSLGSSTKANSAIAIYAQLRDQLDRAEAGEPVSAAVIAEANKDLTTLDLASEAALSATVRDRFLALGDGGNADLAALRRALDASEAVLEADIALEMGLREGGREIADLTGATVDGGPSPLSRLIGPLASSGVLIFFGLLLVLGLCAFTARQWTHNERLQHPLVQVPTALTDAPTLRHRGFWIAIVIMLIIWVYQLGATYDWHVLPGLPLGTNDPLVQMADAYKFFGIEVRPDAKWVYTNHWGSLRIFPYVIAIAFLLAADVGFSIWGGFFFGCLIFGYLAQFGVPVSFYHHARKHGGSGGAMVAMAVVIFWLGRHHYWSLIRSALFLRQEPVDGLGVFGARLTLFSGFGLLLATWWYAGADSAAFGASLIAVAMAVIFIVVTARIVAESGLACFQAASHSHEMIAGLGIPWLLPIKAVMLLNYLGATMMLDTRQFLPGYTVQSTAMADKAGSDNKGFMILLTAVVLVGAVLAMGAGLLGMWMGDGGLDPDRAHHAFGSAAIIATSNSTLKPVFLGLTEKQLSVLGGFLLVFAVVGLRRIWTGCILHPLGLVVAASWPIHLAWGSLALGWLIKVLVLRYGGSSLYSYLKPVAYGIILGDVLGYGLQIVIQTGFAANGQVLEVYAPWP